MTDPALPEPHSPAALPAKGSRRVLLIVFFTVFLDLVGFGIIIPIQPFYAESFGASAAVVTLLGASYSLMQFLFASFWGRLSDRVGRRPVMLVSILFGVIGYVLFGLAGSLPLLFAARMLSGFGNANIGTAQAIIADSTDAAGRARGMGLIGAAFGLGFIFGPAIGGLFSPFGLAVPAFIAAGLGACNWILALFLLPETRVVRPGAGAIRPATRRVPLSIAALLRAMRQPAIARLLTLFLFVTLAFALMEQVLGLFIEHAWMPAAGDVSVGTARALRAAKLTTWILLAVGIAATVVQGGLIGPLVRRFGERKLVIAGTTILAISLAITPIVAGTAVFALMIALGAVWAIGSSITTPSLASLLSLTVGDEEQGGMLGLGQSLSALGRVLGPAAAGWLFEIGPGLPFQVGGGLMALCAIVALGVRAPERARKTG